MKLTLIKDILSAEIITCKDKLDTIVVEYIAAADMMSEVLAFSKEHAAILTGLITPQVVRTAQMMDLSAIIFVRGKQPLEETIKLAEELEIPLLVTNELLYTACGKLYQAGVPSC